MKNLSIKTAIVVSITTVTLGACTTASKLPNYEPAAMPITKVSTAKEVDCGPDNMPVANHMINNNGKPSKSIKIRVTGYGAPPKSFYPDPQRRLMAMRAAKIDAYRSLAERVTGVQIWGGTTIGDMVVEKDRFRVYLDTHLTGARVIAENPQEDGTYETVVELKVGQTFLSQALPPKPEPKKVHSDCAPSKQSPYRLTKPATPRNQESEEDKFVMSNFYIGKD